MPDDAIAAAHAWLADHEDALVADLQELLRIPSLEDEAQPNAPFGAENRRALDLMLSKSESWGWRTADVEGYCGWAEFGKGDDIVMILGHLDVVPVGETGWEHEPFGAEIDGGYLYSRGAVDDKGPTIAACYAARAVQQALPDLACRIRTVYGCNEESGFACVERYKETEEMPTYGIAPDAGWPLCHAEKGIGDLIISGDLPQGELSLRSLRGGSRPNIVIDSCLAEIEVSSSIRGEVEAALAKKWDKNIQASWEGEALTLEAAGKAAHGSTPFMGDSAAIRILRFLTELAPAEQEKDYKQLLSLTHIGGAGVGIAGSDEPSGDLTCNLGIVESAEPGRCTMTLNIRYPVTHEHADLEAKAKAALAKISGDWQIDSFSDSKPLYFPKDHPMVEAIITAHAAETGERLEPATMGGGTYARALPNCVAVGTGWPGDGPAHENDERVKVEHLHKMARIYVRILIGLTRLTD